MRVYKNWLSKRLDLSKKHLEASYNSARNTYINIAKKHITLTDNKRYMQFVSCSYLNLHNDSRIVNAVKNSNALQQQGFLFSSSRTRVISCLQKQSLNKLNQVFEPYKCAIFPNLHTAHLGVLPLLVSGQFPKMQDGRNHKIYCLMDKFAHQSLKILIGILKQFCQVEFVDMTNLQQLEQVMSKKHSSGGCAFLILDSVGSMGKIYNIKHITNLVYKYNGYAYFDDAHGMSILGRNGSGYVLKQLNYQTKQRVFISTSLTKGFGAQGGAILMPFKQQIDFIMQYATTYTFSGPMSIPTLQAINASCNIHLSQQQISKLQNKLSSNALYFDSKFYNNNMNPFNNTFLPFRIVTLNNEEHAIQAYKTLKEKGILVTCAVYPVVEIGKAILRITFSAAHEFQDIDMLVKQLKQIVK